MGATSRALAALTATCVLALPAASAAAVPTEDPASPTAPATAPGSAISGTANTASSTNATVNLRPNGAPVDAPPIAADAWLIADLDSGDILASKQPDLPVRPASTLKLLTAQTVAPRLAPDQPYRAVKADETAEGNRVVLYAGLTYTIADLMHAALLPSANDAAAALARANGGIATTVEQMNAEARRLGAMHTTAKTPSGLDEDGQTTTARDMAVIGRAALANPEIAEYLRLKEAPFPGKMENGQRVTYPIYNHNTMLKHTDFAGALGGKSGYTSKAGNTLVAAAQRDGRRLIVTLFHIGGNTYRTGEALLNWGFANAAALQPVGQLPEPSAPAPVFDRSIQALPADGAVPTNRQALTTQKQSAADAPTATAGASGWALPIPGLPRPSLPSPLTILTLLVGVLVVLRARVYWIGHRQRTAWTELDSWARSQARSSRRRAPAGRRPRHPSSPPVDLRGPSVRAEPDPALTGTPR